MINYIAIILITIIYFILGALWYSPFLFGNIWMESLGYKQEDLNPEPKMFIGAAISAFITTIFFAVLLEFINNYDILTSILISLIISLGFILTIGFYDVLYEDKPLIAYLVDAGYHITALFIAGIILGLWKI